MRVIAIVAAVAALCTSTAEAQDRHPDWLKKPSLQDIMGVFPRAAFEKGLEGRARIRCIVTVQGALRACQVVSESPTGQGFGQAAIIITSQLLMKPALKGGVPVEDEVTIPFEFPNPNPTTGSLLAAGSPLRALPTRVYSNIPWSAAPTVADVVAAYPEKARKAKVTGRATYDCVIDGDGRLGSCEMLNEQPEGYGFAGAARSLIRKFQGPTKDGQGQPLRGGHTQVLIGFSDSLDGPDPKIGKPHWVALPAAEDFNAAFPEAATKAGVLKARVVIDCLVGSGGLLSDCRAEAEEPAGYGLGASAATLAGKFRLAIWTVEGLPTVGGRVSVPIRWEMTEAPQPPAKP